MSLRLETAKQFNEAQQKYAYYIIGLSVACIAFSINKTSGKALSLSQIPLALAVLAWSIAIISGFRRNNFVLDVLWNQAEIYKMKEGNIMGIGYNESKTMEDLVKTNEGLSDRAVIKWRIMNWGFYLGLGLFIIWHLLEMYLNSNF